MIVDVRPRGAGKSHDLLLWAARREPDEVRIIVVASEERERYLIRLSMKLELPQHTRSNIYTIEEILKMSGPVFRGPDNVRVLVAFDDVDDCLARILRGRAIPALAMCSTEEPPAIIRADYASIEQTTWEQMLRAVPTKPLPSLDFKIPMMIPIGDTWSTRDWGRIVVTQPTAVPKIEEPPAPPPETASIETRRFAELDLEEES